MIKLTIGGSEELKAKLRAASDPKKDLAKALHVEAESIMTKAKKLTPVDTGVLRASGVVRRPDIRSGRVDVELGFGGAARAYALVQHERTDYHHTVGQAKFLEQPVKEARRGLGQRLAKHLDLF